MYLTHYISTNIIIGLSIFLLKSGQKRSYSKNKQEFRGLGGIAQCMMQKLQTCEAQCSHTQQPALLQKAEQGTQDPRSSWLASSTETENLDGFHGADPDSCIHDFSSFL